MMMEWLVPFTLYVLGLCHHARAIRTEIRAAERVSIQHQQLVLIREARALAAYGAHAEAQEAIDRAIALGE